MKLFLALVALATTPGRAQEVTASEAVELLPPAETAPGPGSIVTFFRGGQAGSNLAEVLRELSGHPDLIPVEEHVVAPGETLCGLLASKGFPEPCEPYVAFMRTLNPGLQSPAALIVGQTIKLPAVNVTARRSSRIFDAATGQAQRILRNWVVFSPRLFAAGSQARVEYDTLELVLRAPDAAHLNGAVAAIDALALPNVSIEAIPFTPSIAQPFSRTASAVQTSCSLGQLATMPVNYVEYAFEDEPARPPTNPGIISPSVFILDVPLISSPNLSRSSGTSPWVCEWHSFSGRDHATHMAGIIASRSGTLGFVGLEPNATIVSEPFMVVSEAAPGAPPVRDNAALLRYRRLFQDAHGRDSLPVFLVASAFRDRAGYAGLGGSQLNSANDRFNGANSAIEVAVRDEQPLLIVAAGQDRSRPGGMELDARTLLSPQNLGDLSNVIIVTACVQCQRRDATVAPDANFDLRRQFVHLAAPGGQELPGWVNTEGIGAASGTSQAAAYVSGVAASMIARHPLRYREARQVKLRLQATSSPLLAADGELSPASSRLATGIVDPELAIRDPSRDWVRTASDWTQVRARRWSNRHVSFQTDQGDERPRDMYSLVRLVQAGPRSWHYVAYLDPDPDSSGSNSSQIRAVDIGTLLDQTLQLELCDGSIIRIGDILDFVPRLGGIPPQPQLAARACDQG